MEFLSLAQSASITIAKNKNERLSELGTEECSDELTNSSKRGSAFVTEERSDEPTNSNKKNNQAVCNIAT